MDDLVSFDEVLPANRTRAAAAIPGSRPSSPAAGEASPSSGTADASSQGVGLGGGMLSSLFQRVREVLAPAGNAANSSSNVGDGAAKGEAGIVGESSNPAPATAQRNSLTRRIFRADSADSETLEFSVDPTREKSFAATRTSTLSTGTRTKLSTTSTSRRPSLLAIAETGKLKSMPSIFTSDFDELDRDLQRYLKPLPSVPAVPAIETLSKRSSTSKDAFAIVTHEGSSLKRRMSRGSIMSNLSLDSPATPDPSITTTTPIVDADKSALSQLVRKIRKLGGQEEMRKDYWLRDEASKECYQCKQTFTTFRRRHHCRICGQVFCGKCSAEVIPGERFGYHNNIRVCDYCVRTMREYSQEPEEHTGAVETYNPNNTASSAMLQHWIRTSSPIILPPGDGSSAITQPPSSLTQFRKIFAHGTHMFSPRFWSSTGSIPPSSASNLPFRNNVSIHEEESSIVNLENSAEVWESPDDSMVHLLSQSNFRRASEEETRSVQSDSELPPTAFPPLNSTSDEIKEAMSAPLTRKDRLQRHARRNTIASLKYSAKTLRNQLQFADPGQRKAGGVESPLSVPPETPVERQVSVSAPVSPILQTSNRPLSPIISEPLPEIFAYHAEQVLRQVLLEFNIENVDVWMSVLLSHILTIPSDVIADIRSGDEIDIRRYVKIKRVPGGNPKDSFLVPGVVCTKNVAHKRMLRSVKNPKILLLRFPLEYHRIEMEFMSIDPVLKQEREYLRKMVNRITALKPDVVMVEKTVSRVALEYLLASNVILISNVKPSVMQQVARCTNAEIVGSLEKITLRSDAKLGTCGKFHIKTFTDPLIPNGRKTLIFFDECDISRGCTLLLRGGDDHVLGKVKRIADLMVFVAYHLKLESELVKNEGAFFRNLDADVAPGKDEPSSVPESMFARFVVPYELRILSITPRIRFRPPFVLDRMRQFELQVSDAEQKELIHEAGQKFVDALLRGEVNTFHLFGTYPAEIKNGLNYLVEHNQTIISPFAHQNIMVLYSNLCTITSLPCHPPAIHTIDYYGETDMTLGQFLEELCFDSNYICPAPTCQRSMLLHCRSYIHDDARLNVLIEEFPSPISGMRDKIMMWSLCKICNSVSNVTPMSPWTWKLSFGKYLELSYYHTDLLAKPESCGHNVARDHIRYFSLHDLAVRFEYETIAMLEVIPPPMNTVIGKEVLHSLKTEDMDVLRQDILKFYQSVVDRVRALSSEEITISPITELQHALVDLSKRIPTEKASILTLLQETYQSTAAPNLFALNQVRKILYEHCLEWDRCFEDIAKRFLLLERVDKKSTANAQIRKLFAENEEAVSSTPGSRRVSVSSRQNLMTVDSSQGGELPAMTVSSTQLEHWNETGPINAPSHAIETLQLPKLEHEGVSAQVLESLDNLARDIGEAEREIADSDEDLRSRESRFGDSLPAPKISRTRSQSRSRHRPPEDRSRSTSRHGEDRSDIGNNVPPVLPEDGAGVAESFSVTLGLSQRSVDEREEPQLPHMDPISPTYMKETQSDVVSETTPSANSVTASEKMNTPIRETKENNKDTPVDGEKSSIMKTLRDLWGNAGGQGNAATGQTWSLVGVHLQPTSLPHRTFVNSSSSEYLFEFSPIIVREEEPSSIIAFALHSPHYRREVSRMRKQQTDSRRPGSKQSGSAVNVEDTEEAVMAGTPLEIPLKPIETRLSTMASLSLAEAGESDELLIIQKTDSKDKIEDILLKGAGTHIKYQFSSGQTKFFCRVYFAEQFDALRRNCGCEEDFVSSLSRCVKWQASGGKSNSAFFKTPDDRFVMKQLSKPEMDGFLRFASAYFEYMSQTFFHELPTVMAKIFGVYRIGYKNMQTGKALKIDVLVMENLFYKRKISRIFDLKGSMRNRKIFPTGQQSEVLLDENLMEIIQESPLFIREHCKRRLRASVWNDTLFLSNLNVMDYSLLVGLDEDGKELVVGIVDFIRTFTWDKKLESWVKETGFLGGGKEPTIVSPRQYKNRFREAMERYFLMVPDKHCDSHSVRQPV